MAVDEAILRAVAAGSVPPTLRFYAWDPACLSLGRAQPVADVDLPALRAAGFDLVRRPTGGAAVLHVDEVTYAVAAPLGMPGLGRAVLEIHSAIAEALAGTFRALGVDVDFGGDGVPQEFACFSGAGGHEMTVEGRKLVGSALRRGRNAFLQHGSVLGSPSHLDLTDFIAGADEDARRASREALEAKTCTLPGLDAAAFAELLARALADRCGAGARRVGPFTELLRA